MNHIEGKNGKLITGKKLKQESLQVLCVFALLLVLCIFFSFTSPYFNKSTNYLNMLRQISVAALLACGMNFVLLVGHIDLSIGSTVAVTGVIAAEVSALTNNITVTIITVLLGGALVGIINGLLIVTFKIPSFIATLAMMSILRGGVLVFTNAKTIFGLKPQLLAFGQGYLGPIPIPVLMMVGIFIIAFIVLTKTKFGLHIYAVGGNAEVARLSGVNVKRILITVYVICGVLAAIAGLVTTARTAAATPVAGAGYELDAITAVVLGGTSMSGGSGSLIGTFLGVAVLGVLSNGLTMLNINVFWVQIIKGIILLVAIIVSVRATDKEKIKKRRKQL